MKNFWASFVLFSVLGLSGLSILSGCSQSSTQTVTVYVHDTIPDWDDSTWTMRPSGTTSNLVRVQFVDSSLGYAAGAAGTVLRTSDAGQTWTALTPAPTTGNGSGNNTCYGIWFFNKLNGIAVGDGNGVYHTSDGGITWYGTTINAQYYLRAIYFINGTTGFIGTSDPVSAGAAGEIWKTTDAGVTWQNVSTNQTGGIYTLSFASQTNGIALGNFGTSYWTSDGGSSWHPGTSNATGQISGGTFTAPTTAYATELGSSSFSGTLLRTTDAGVTWNSVHDASYGTDAIAFNGTSEITAVGFNGGITESTDNGATWTDSQFGNNRWIGVAYLSANRSVIVGEQGQIATRHRQF
ncbi:MAG TPA: YCF48-related protein [Candidatus Kapabacteria bacterium]|jgi:photosystem II stability/assembly factor-like uncharacterized protein|nr:YCF48-related protein [Candidatus Kapabacteria bacterium]